MYVPMVGHVWVCMCMGVSVCIRTYVYVYMHVLCVCVCMCVCVLSICPCPLKHLTVLATANSIQLPLSSQFTWAVLNCFNIFKDKSIIRIYKSRP